MADKSYAFPEDEVARAEELLGQGNAMTTALKPSISNATTAGIMSALIDPKWQLTLAQSCASQEILLLRRSANTTLLKFMTIDRLREQEAAAAT